MNSQVDGIDIPSKMRTSDFKYLMRKTSGTVQMGLQRKTFGQD